MDFMGMQRPNFAPIEHGGSSSNTRSGRFLSTLKGIYNNEFQWSFVKGLVFFSFGVFAARKISELAIEEMAHH
uniref:Uncharacterized protein n=1 Tax=Romanomermis culicivorax TaxID=13658 RepID=A0A915IIX5_ROMCU